MGGVTVRGMPPGPPAPRPAGKYELVGVVTHKGRTADSGHYVAWVKQADGATWVCFDDDKLTLRTEQVGGPPGFGGS